MQYEMSRGVPVATLYRGLGELKPDGHGPFNGMGAVEFLLYNMASMLAGVAAGYDVRLSNVMPIHPKLLPKMPNEDENDRPSYYGGAMEKHAALCSPYKKEFVSATDKMSKRYMYPHNTYHGATNRQRAPLNYELKPLKFIDTAELQLSRERSPSQDDRIDSAQVNLIKNLLIKM